MNEVKMKINPNKNTINISSSLKRGKKSKIANTKPMRDAIDKTNKDQDNLLLIINNLNTNIMILKISNPREAIIQSYTRPIAYKDYILLDGEVVIAFI